MHIFSNAEITPYPTNRELCAFVMGVEPPADVYVLVWGHKGVSSVLFDGYAVFYFLTPEIL